jgi:hypothetical protein
MSDSRFPYLLRADGTEKIPTVYPHDAVKILSFCKSVENRTGCKAWFNRVTSRVLFCLGDPSTGLEYVKVVDRGVAKVPDEDEVCKRIYKLREPMRVKEQRLENNAKDEIHDKEEHKQKIITEAAEAAAPRIKHDQNKMKMGKHSRPIVTVP